MTSPITVLTTCDGKLATKRWYVDVDGNIKSSGYENAFKFEANVYPVKDIRDFYQAIKWLESRPNDLVVRGIVFIVTPRYSR